MGYNEDLFVFLKISNGSSTKKPTILQGSKLRQDPYFETKHHNLFFPSLSGSVCLSRKTKVFMRIYDEYPLVMTNSLLLKMAIYSLSEFSD